MLLSFIKFEVYDAEKQRMNAGEVRNDDIIRLNVGGKKLCTTRATLCQVEGSFLASLFSGRWEGTHDDDGAVFFDYNPQFFVAILNYLRAKKFATTENPALPPKVPKDQLEDFKTFVQYLRLSDEIFPREQFNQHSSTGVTLEEDGIIAVHDPNKAEYRYVLGQNIYRQGTHSLKLKLETFQDNFWMFVGILNKDILYYRKTIHMHGLVHMDGDSG